MEKARVFSLTHDHFGPQYPKGTVFAIGPASGYAGSDVYVLDLGNGPEPVCVDKIIGEDAFHVSDGRVSWKLDSQQFAAALIGKTVSAMVPVADIDAPPAAQVIPFPEPILHPDIKAAWEIIDSGEMNGGRLFELARVAMRGVEAAREDKKPQGVVNGIYIAWIALGLLLGLPRGEEPDVSGAAS